MLRYCRSEGAIGTAEWEGVTLASVLEDCGGLIKGGKHLELYGADTYFKQASSLPLMRLDLAYLLLWPTRTSL